MYLALRHALANALYAEPPLTIRRTTLILLNHHLENSKDPAIQELNAKYESKMDTCRTLLNMGGYDEAIAHAIISLADSTQLDKILDGVNHLVLRYCNQYELAVTENLFALIENNIKTLFKLARTHV